MNRMLLGFLFFTVAVLSPPIMADEVPGEYIIDALQQGQNVCVVLAVQPTTTKYRLTRLGGGQTEIVLDEYIFTSDEHVADVGFPVSDFCVPIGSVEYTLFAAFPDDEDWTAVDQKVIEILDSGQSCGEEDDPCNGIKDLIDQPDDKDDSNEDDEGCGCTVAVSSPPAILTMLMLLIGLVGLAFSIHKI